MNHIDFTSKITRNIASDFITFAAELAINKIYIRACPVEGRMSEKYFEDTVLCLYTVRYKLYNIHLHKHFIGFGTEGIKLIGRNENNDNQGETIELVQGFCPKFRYP